MRANHPRRPALLAGVGLALALIAPAACTVPAQGPFNFAEYRPGPAVFNFEVFFRSGAADLTPDAAAELRVRLEDTLVREGDGVLIYVGSTGDPTIDAARQASVRAAIAGVPGRVQIILLAIDPANDRDVVAVEVRRNASLVVECPDQTTDFVDNAYGRNALSMGCTNAINIASMANDPRELHTPSPLVGSDGVAAVRAVDNYRADQVKAYTPLDSSISGF